MSEPLTRKQDLAKYIIDNPATPDVVQDVKDRFVLSWYKADDAKRAELANLINALDFVMNEFATIYAGSVDMED